MRLTYIVAAVVAVTLHTSVTAFSPVRDSKSAIENGAAVDLVHSAEGGRLLRRVNNDYDDLDDLDGLDGLDGFDDDASDEERGFGDALKKINPVTAVKKSMKSAAEHSAKIKQALKEADDYQKMLDKAGEIVSKD